MTKFDLDRFGKVMSRLLVMCQRKINVIFMVLQEFGVIKR